MRVGSICSGISADSVAWRPLGWRHQFFSEIDPFCCKVLHHYYPEVPNYGDFTAHTGFASIDVLMVSTPCQDFSVAGRRAGLDGARGSLTMGALRVIAETRPRWLVFENVPGLLQADCAPGFGDFLSRLAGIGYGTAYGVLDAQYFGLAQRRERVFVVGYLGDWRPAAAVLSDLESLCGHPAPRREAGQGAAPTLAARTKGGGGLGTDFDCDGGLIPETSMCLNAKGGSGRIDGESETFIAHSLRADGFDASEDGTGRKTPLVPVCRETAATIGERMRGQDDSCADNLIAAYPILEAGARTGKSTSDPRAGIGIGQSDDPMYTLQGGKQHAVAFSCKDHGADAGDVAPTLRAMGHTGSHPNAGGQVAVAFTERTRSDGRSLECQEDLAYALTNPGAGGRSQERNVGIGMAVRRLTPRECERLMGYPDDYTLIPEYRKRQKECGPDAEALHAYYCRTERGRQHVEMRDGRVYSTPDGPRYKALGNSIAVPVLAWIGVRIEMVEEILKERAA